MKRFSFPKSSRLLKNGQFKAVLARRLSASDGLLTLYMAENDCGRPRLGVSVGKSCGGAVVRSRLKRLLREAFRQSQDRIPSGFDYLLMICPQWPEQTGESGGAKEVAKQLAFEQVRASFLALVECIVRKNEIK